MTSENSRTLLSIEVSMLRATSRNARTHSKRQVRQIADSIEQYGFTNSILIGDDNDIIAGHGRLAAAKLLGITHVPCIRLANLSVAQKRAYVIADNKLALNAGWDTEILAIEFQELAAEGFDLTGTGFDLTEIDGILFDVDQSSATPAMPEDDLPEQHIEATTREGDLWNLGRHRLLCGDAKDPKAVARLMEGQRAAMLITDPPYNVPIAGHVSGLGRTKHREFVEASGEMSPEAFTEFLRLALASAAGACRDGAIAFVFMDWRHLGEIQAAGCAVFYELKNVCIWVKTNGGMGSFYRSQHELGIR